MTNASFAVLFGGPANDINAQVSQKKKWLLRHVSIQVVTEESTAWEKIARHLPACENWL